MPACGTCGKRWPDSYQVCPDDGSRLTTGLEATTASSGNAAVAVAEAAQTANDDLASGSFAGEYRIETKLGEGGMGSVYGARHPLIGKRAAIKVIKRELSASREATDRFVLEAQAVNQIGHPNIVDVFAFGQLPDGRNYFAMEWLQGESLRARMQRSLPLPDALDIVDTIAKALEAAHAAGVLHRDLKPDNVFLVAMKGERPTVKVLDFGLAKLSGNDDGRMDRTRTGVVMGTPLYLSPEQAKGEKADSPTDVYSLGAVTYEMLAGVVPFKADSAIETMAMHISAVAPALRSAAPWVPTEIEALVTAMLAKDPRQRPTMTQVRERLAVARAAGLPQAAPQPGGSGDAATPMAWSATPPSTAPALEQTAEAHRASMTTPPRSRRKRGLVIGLVALGVAIAGVVVVATNHGAAEPTKPAIAEAAKPDTRLEPAKPEAAKPEAANPEPVKPEPVKPEPVKPEKPEPEKPEPAKTKPGVDPRLAKPEVAKVDKTKPEPKPKLVHVKITVPNHPRAIVTVDGRKIERPPFGPLDLELAIGDHTIRADVKGFLSAEQHVYVDGPKDVRIPVTRAPSRERPNANDEVWR